MSDTEQLIYLAAFKYVASNTTALTRLMVEAIKLRLEEIDTDFLAIMRNNIINARSKSLSTSDSNALEDLLGKINLELKHRNFLTGDIQ